MADAPDIIVEDQNVDVEKVEEVKIQVRSPFVDETLKKFNRESIWNLKDLVNRETKDYKEECKYMPEHWDTIITKKFDIAEDFIEKMYCRISSAEQCNKGTLKFRNIVKFLHAWHILDKTEIDSNKYTLILEVAKIVNDISNFRINGFADLIISKLLTLCRNKQTEFEKIGNAYLFAHKLSEIIKNRYLINAELSYLVACIKCRIYDLMGEVEEISDKSPEEWNLIQQRNDEKMKEAIKYILIARENNADLNVFIESFVLSLNQWREIKTISENFDYSILEKETQFKDFDPIVEDKETEYPEEPEPIKVEEEKEEVFEAKKMNVIYMTNQGLVQVGIFKAHVIENGKIIAVKECVSPTLEMLQGYIEEAKVLKKLSGASKNFLEYYASKLEMQSEGDNQKYVFTIQMEYVETTLKSDKHQRDLKNKPYNDIEILQIYKQLILAFNQMRGMNILHCDIKPSNIMITHDFVIKIIDFNTAKIGIDEKTQLAQAAGTKDYMSPEIREAFESGRQANIKEDKADVFSLGLTILSLITNKPLVDLNLKKNESKLQEIIELIRYDWLKPILSGMLEFDYSKRSGLKDLIVHFPTDASVTYEV